MADTSYKLTFPEVRSRYQILQLTTWLEEHCGGGFDVSPIKRRSSQFSSTGVVEWSANYATYYTTVLFENVEDMVMVRLMREDCR